MAIGKNIKFHRKVRLGWTLDKLESASGVDRGTISALENRDSSKSDHFAKIAHGLGLTLDQLLIPPEDWDLTSIDSNTSKKIKSDEIMINQYHGVRGSMGGGLSLPDQPGQITRWTVTPEWIIKNLPSHTGANNLSIITGFGDSMVGMYNPGDPLIVDTGVKNCDHDGVYFFRVGNEGYVKRLQRIPNVGIVVISKNTEYKEWTITPDMDFEVLAKVLKVWESKNF